MVGLRTKSGVGNFLFLFAANKIFFKRASDIFWLILFSFFLSFSLSLSLALLPFVRREILTVKREKLFSQRGFPSAGQKDGVRVCMGDYLWVVCVLWAYVEKGSCWGSG